MDPQGRKAANHINVAVDGMELRRRK